MTLYKHQEEFLNINPNKCSLVWSCGTGKTRTAIEWASTGESTLVICPKALKANWNREIEKYSITDKSPDGQFWTVVTKEEFRRDWKELHYVDSVIVDEVHNGFLTPGFKSQMSKALRSYIKKHNVPRILLLSATVYTSSPWNIYNLAYYTGHKWDYRKFQYDFFVQVPMGIRSIWMPKKGIEEKLAKLTKSIASVVDINDVIDVPLQNHTEPEYFALTKEQEKAIKDSYDPVPIVRYTYQHEIENGVLLGNEFRMAQEFKCDKEERILQLCEENKKVAIVCRYNNQIDKLFLMLQTKLQKSIYMITGQIKNRDEITLQAEKADNCIILIQADCNAGYQLPSFELCIFASMSYSYVAHEQLCGRFLRMDRPSRTTFMYLLTEGDSLDNAVYECVMKKKDFQINLYGQK